MTHEIYEMNMKLSINDRKQMAEAILNPKNEVILIRIERSKDGETLTNLAITGMKINLS